MRVYNSPLFDGLVSMAIRYKEKIFCNAIIQRRSDMDNPLIGKDQESLPDVYASYRSLYKGPSLDALIERIENINLEGGDVLVITLNPYSNKTMSPDAYRSFGVLPISIDKLAEMLQFSDAASISLLNSELKDSITFNVRVKEKSKVIMYPIQYMFDETKED